MRVSGVQHAAAITEAERKGGRSGARPGTFAEQASMLATDRAYDCQGLYKGATMT